MTCTCSQGTFSYLHGQSYSSTCPVHGHKWVPPEEPPEEVVRAPAGVIRGTTACPNCFTGIMLPVGSDVKGLRCPSCGHTFLL